MGKNRLGIGIVGSGFNARFHLQAFLGLRDAEVLGIWSPNEKNTAEAAGIARNLDVGEARTYRSISEMVADPSIEAIWLCGPNHARVENVEEIVSCIERGKGTLKGLACEKPLARNVAEAKRVLESVARVNLRHGYLENQLFAPAVMSGWNWLAGGILIVIGEWIRMSGVAAAGTVTRRRSRDVQRLVTYGIFRWVRNPLYVGNFLIWMGFVVISGVLWFLPLAVLLFAVEYSLIVAYEEGVLESIFGAEYLDYKRTTPRWIPRPPGSRAETGPHDWGEAWRSEISTFMQYAALILVFSIKDFLAK